MTSKEAAKFLGVSVHDVERYTNQGKLNPRYERKDHGIIMFYETSELLELKNTLQIEPPQIAPQGGISSNPPLQKRTEFPYSPRIRNILACPFCMQPLQETNEGVRCSACSTLYDYTEWGTLDLRLRSPKTYRLEFQLPSSLSQCESDLAPSRPGTPPEIDHSGGRTPYQMPAWWKHYFPTARVQDSLMLDLGCGSVIQRETCEQAGYEYVGLDYCSPHAHILGDAHSLPFQDNSFELILSVALLEHVRYPFIVTREAYRVLKPGGKFLGTVAFLEPFHANSFYHHTHLGIYNSLQYGGFTIEHIVPSGEWSVLIAQANMALFPGMSIHLAKCLVSPLQWLHRLWWRIDGKKHEWSTEDARIRNTTGAFCFVARKG